MSDAREPEASVRSEPAGTSDAREPEASVRSEPVTYAGAGVDIEAGERAVALMRSRVAATRRAEVVDELGGFAGLFRLDLSRYREPVLATATDGVGTKLAIARLLDRHDTVGIDLVAMVADDIVACGAEPLFLTDYIACGTLVPERVSEIVGGVAEGCRQAGCALIGGETAEHPGVLEHDEYDLAGAGTGVVEAGKVLGRHRVRDGDVVIGMASSGLHSNGFSLVRHVVQRRGWDLDTVFPELDDAASLGEVLLTPTRIYAPDCLALADAGGVHAFAHVTGGGLPNNLARVLPRDLDASVDRSTWTPPRVFTLLSRRGGIADDEMERTFNMGIGMVAVVAATEADEVIRSLAERGVPAWTVGRITPGSGQVRCTGDFRLG